jgi:hypothetical protein
MPLWTTSGAIMRFTIRDMLWLMVVVAILSLWAVERQDKKLIDYWLGSRRYQADLRKTIQKQSAEIEELNAELKRQQILREALMSQLLPPRDAPAPAPLTASGPGWNLVQPAPPPVPPPR